MSNRASDSSIKPKKSDEVAIEISGALSSEIFQLKKQIQSDRLSSIREKLRRNEKNLKVNTHQILRLATSRKDLYIKEPNGSKSMLFYRIESPLCKLSGYAQGLGERDNVHSQEVVPSIIFKLPFTEKIPPYTTWIFLDKNQRMAEDQSVVGRRRIYYDQYGGETLICSDSEEEITPDEEKHEFSEGEDQMLWKAFQEHGVTQEVLTIVSQTVKASSSEIQDRYIALKERYQEKHPEVEGSGKTVSERDIILEKSLNAALDSFDNLFCRRCLVFDCRLHGCSQSLIIPSEKQPYSCGSEENRKPCSEQCYLRARKGIEDISERSVADALRRIQIVDKDGILLTSKSEPSPGNVCRDIIIDERFSDGNRAADISPVISKSAVGALTSNESILPIPSHENLGKRKVLKDVSITLGCSTLCSDKFQHSGSKKLKKISGSVAYVASEDQQNSGLISSTNIVHPFVGSLDANEKKKPEHVSSELIGYACKKYVVSCTVDSEKINDNAREHEENNNIHVSLLKQSSDSTERQFEETSMGCEWKPIEKELYLKGIEIFGKNSCLISRNLLAGLKTCKEVSIYMLQDGDATIRKSAAFPGLEDNGNPATYNMDHDMPTRSRIFRRRGRTRKLKYTWKSAGHPSSRKRLANGKDQKCKQYTPCECKFMCGKDCSCHQNGTCCEKYCGCSKSCKNRFRGCHCAKSQCRSRQCPCFAAGRECDPDVCRNCWVSCGDGSLGEPSARGDGYQCGNMQLLLKQKQRILLSKSEVAGWGAFIKNPVNKNDYLGEYTGELISHREADKRGKIYDRANSSYLFDLNDQCVLDAYRKGDKLKFANHSASPNCYAKVMLVAGDHRVGIFAKERIDASEEIFYDYRYGPDEAPIWARNPQAFKRDDPSVPHGRAKKHQSHA